MEIMVLILQVLLYKVVMVDICVVEVVVDTTVELVETIKTIMDHQVLVVALDILDTLVYQMHQLQEQI